MYVTLKVLITAVTVVAVAEIAKRSTVFGALVASLPLTSILAIIWLYHDTGDTQRVVQLSYDIFWLVLPSLAFFVLLPLLLRAGFNFYLALSLASLGMAGFYAIFRQVIHYLGL